MNEHDRGMMKWAPYQSLIEQATALARMRYEKGKRPRPLISSDRAREINEILTSYQGEEVEAAYYEDGYRYSIKGIITEISRLYRYLVIDEKQISFVDLLELTSSRLAPVDAWAC